MHANWDCSDHQTQLITQPVHATLVERSFRSVCVSFDEQTRKSASEGIVNWRVILRSGRKMAIYRLTLISIWGERDYLIEWKVYAIVAVSLWQERVIHVLTKSSIQFFSSSVLDLNPKSVIQIDLLIIMRVFMFINGVTEWRELVCFV